MAVFITGSEGFIGKNLALFLEPKNYNIIRFKKGDNLDKTFSKVKSKDIIVHLAGQNRSKNKHDFDKNNTNLTKKISNIVIKKKAKVKFIYASTSHNGFHKYYIKTKKESEKILKQMQKKTNSQLYILRLPNIFGKWSKPNYNSVVATFCYNISKKKKIKINKINKKISFLYIDDLANQIYGLIKSKKYKKQINNFKNIYSIKISQLAEKIYLCKSIFENNLVFNVDDIFMKNLYSTYLSFVPISKISKKIKQHEDKRGSFIEFIKDKKLGQISFITINKNSIRGNHFHHTKLERFFLINGKVKFNLKNLKNNHKKSFTINSKSQNFIEIPPGWAHNIKNMSNNTSTLAVWANEIYDKKKPDTIQKSVT